MAQLEETRNWPELAIGLYDKLTERDAEIAYAFDNFELGISRARLRPIELIRQWILR